MRIFLQKPQEKLVVVQFSLKLDLPSEPRGEAVVVLSKTEFQLQVIACTQQPNSSQSSA